jgi:nicotinamide mononucleotide transporter
MVDFISQAIGGFSAMSGWEYLAVLLSVVYLLLAMKQSLWCWPAAFFSTLIYTLLFFNGALLMESLLNVFYMSMAIYGWYCWRQPARADNRMLPVTSLSLTIHSQMAIATFTIAMVLGYIMDNYTRADFAYLDSITTCYSVLATYLLAKKILENWLYWVIIDAVSIYLFVNKGYYPTTVLFIFYTLMAVRGYFQWHNSVIDDSDYPAVPSS